MGKYVGIFAHPDDETFGAGGTLALLAQQHDVEVICCTDGDHQEKQLKTVRQAELRRASELLGIHRVHQLDFADGHLCNANYHHLADQLKSLLDQLQPEVAITFHPNGLSGHLDHVAVTSVVNFLFPRLSYLQEVWYLTRLREHESGDDYFVYRPPGEPREHVHKIIDINSTWDLKQQAMLQHVSQADDAHRLIQRMSGLPKEEYFLVRSKREVG